MCAPQLGPTHLIKNGLDSFFHGCCHLRLHDPGGGRFLGALVRTVQAARPAIEKAVPAKAPCALSKSKSTKTGIGAADAHPIDPAVYASRMAARSMASSRLADSQVKQIRRQACGGSRPSASPITERSISPRRPLPPGSAARRHVFAQIIQHDPGNIDAIGARRIGSQEDLKQAREILAKIRPSMRTMRRHGRPRRLAGRGRR